MAEAVFTKDPQAGLDYSIDWSDWLSNDTIVTSTWTVPTGITKVTDTKTTTVTTVWLSGGTVGQAYDVMNEITTTAGRKDDRTIRIRVENK